MTRKRIIWLSALLILLAFLEIIPNAMAFELLPVPDIVSNKNPTALPTQSQTGSDIYMPRGFVEEKPMISEQGYQDYLKKINKSNLTQEEKSFYRELLKQIKDNSSTLSMEEKVNHIIDIAYIDHPLDLKKDKNILELKSNQDIINTSNKAEKSLLQWTGYYPWSHTNPAVGDVHNYMAYNAGKYVGFNDYWSDRIGAEATGPDVNGWIPLISQVNHFVISGNPTQAYTKAQLARDAYRAGQGDPWITNMAYCMHYPDRLRSGITFLRRIPT